MADLCADRGVSISQRLSRGLSARELGGVVCRSGAAVSAVAEPQESVTTSMAGPSLDPLVFDKAPAELVVTPYDHEHVVTYLRLLDADKEGVDWRGVARIVLHIDPEREPKRARHA